MSANPISQTPMKEEPTMFIRNMHANSCECDFGADDFPFVPQHTSLASAMQAMNISYENDSSFTISYFISSAISPFHQESSKRENRNVTSHGWGSMESRKTYKCLAILGEIKSQRDQREEQCTCKNIHSSQGMDSWGYFHDDNSF